MRVSVLRRGDHHGDGVTPRDIGAAQGAGEDIGMARKDQEPTRTCFVIAPIGEEGSPARIRSDKVFRHVIKPVCDECGYSALRSDIEPTPGMIGHQIISHLLRDDLVIADLTGLNANVFYELAIRHMVRKPVVQLIRKGETLPFDITQSRTIFLDHTDLDSVEACRREMIDQIHEMERDPDLVENPVSQAVRIEDLGESEDPKERRDADILAHLDRISYQVELLLLDRRSRQREFTEDANWPGEFAPEILGGGRDEAIVASILDTSVTLEQAVETLKRLRNNRHIHAEVHRDGPDPPE
jgi:hypothetical protein